MQGSIGPGVWSIMHKAVPTPGFSREHLVADAGAAGTKIAAVVRPNSNMLIRFFNLLSSQRELA